MNRTFRIVSADTRLDLDRDLLAAALAAVVAPETAARLRARIADHAGGELAVNRNDFDALLEAVAAVERTEQEA